MSVCVDVGAVYDKSGSGIILQKRKPTWAISFLAASSLRRFPPGMDTLPIR